MTARASPHPSLRHRARRVSLLTLVALAASAVALFLAVHRVPWLGPALANGLRRVIGAEAVTWLEEGVYAVEDRWNRLWRSGEAPQAYWAVPSASVEAQPPVADAASTLSTPRATFQPKTVGPVHARLAAPGDGVWVAVLDPAKPDAPALMYKTLLHPDLMRPWAAVFVVALDAPAIELGLMAGTEDPAAVGTEARAAARPACVPAEEQPRLVAAFNGGFKTEHGHYGMHASGVTLVPPRPDVCTIVRWDDGTLGIATWKDLAARRDRMTWWRQTPPCMVEHGKLHPGLTLDTNTNWGAALGGETAIRRSAVALDATGKTLFVAVSEHTTARAIAIALKHAGGEVVAQLDVNWSFPKFVVYRQKDQRLVAEGLFPGFVMTEDEYVRGRAPKDFFYVLRRPAAERQ